MNTSLLHDRIITCSKCPRLARYRVEVAHRYAHLYPGEEFWAKPVPGYGDPQARLVIVGLAPAARGGNRTGRVFTGDESGNNLAQVLHKVGLATKPTSTHRGDGFELRGAYLTAAVKCVPPDNRPTRSEVSNCRDFLVEEIRLLREARVFLALGSIAWTSLVESIPRALEVGEDFRPPRFAHGLEVNLETRSRGRVYLLSSYHPSPRNVRTGLLSLDELERILRRAAALAGLGPL